MILYYNECVDDTVKMEVILLKQKVLTSLFTTSIIAGVAAVSESEAATSYKVKAGDTLWGIAQSYHTSVAKLKEMNGLTGDTIYVNQYLSVPSIHSKDNGHVYKNSHAPNVYTVKAGDTLFDIGRRFNMNYHDIMRNNHLSSSLIHPGQQLSLTTTSQVTHVAKAPKAKVGVKKVRKVRRHVEVAQVPKRLTLKQAVTNYLNRKRLSESAALKVSQNDQTKVENVLVQTPQVQPQPEVVKPEVQVAPIVKKTYVKRQDVNVQQPEVPVVKVENVQSQTTEHVVEKPATKPVIKKVRVKREAVPKVETPAPQPSVKPNVEPVVQTTPVSTPVQPVVTTPVTSVTNQNRQFLNNTYAWGNCTYHVFNHRQEIGRTIGQFWGNANNWANAASQNGFLVNGTPEVGAILHTTAGWAGHVAFIERINADGSLVVSEMNFNNPPGIMSTRTIPASEVGNYSYIH